MELRYWKVWSWGTERNTSSCEEGSSFSGYGRSASVSMHATRKTEQAERQWQALRYGEILREQALRYGGWVSTPSPHKPKAPPQKHKAPCWKLSGDGSDCAVPGLSEFTPVFVSVWQQWVCDIPGAHLQGSKTRNRQDIRAEPQLISTVVTCAQGWIQGGRLGRSLPPKTYESNFFHHDFEQFGKQHSRYKAILPSIVLSQQCREAYFIFFTVVNP